MLEVIVEALIGLSAAVFGVFVDKDRALAMCGMDGPTFVLLSSFFLLLGAFIGFGLGLLAAGRKKGGDGHDDGNRGSGNGVNVSGTVSSPIVTGSNVTINDESRMHEVVASDVGGLLPEELDEVMSGL